MTNENARWEPGREPYHISFRPLPHTLTIIPLISTDTEPNVAINPSRVKNCPVVAFLLVGDSGGTPRFYKRMSETAQSSYSILKIFG